MIDIKALTRKLADYEPLDLSETLVSYAAVAVMLRITEDQRTWLGYIKRAIHEGDRWSGHIAFPGGKHEPQDRDSRETATRETLEEIGVSLSEDTHLGRLDDIQARGRGGMLPFYIRPHVFVVRDEPALILDPREVAAFDWVNLEWLLNASNRRVHSVATSGGTLEMPGISMPDGSILWGLTLRITEMLLTIGLPQETSRS